MKVEKLDENVYYYTETVTEEELQLILNLLKDPSGWNRVYDEGKVYNPNRDPDAFESQSILIAARKKFIDLSKNESTIESKIFDRVLKEATEHYRLDKNISGDGNIPPFTHVDRHSLGSIYRSHIDTAPLDVEGYTVLLYINDDYEGGELSFTIFKGGEVVHNGLWFDGPKGTYRPYDEKNKDLISFWIKPKPMSVVIFPPLHPYPHTSHEITSGDKYMVKSFWQLENRQPKAWSSTPFNNLNKEDIARINPEAFIIDSQEANKLQGDLPAVPDEWKIKKY